MSLLEEAQRRVKKAGPLCAVRVVFDLNPKRAAEITELLAAVPERIPYTVAADTLSEALNAKVPADTISRHKRGKCGCEPA